MTDAAQAFTGGASIERAQVVREGDELVVTWEAGGPVAVTVSESPDDRGVPVADQRDAGRVALTGLDPLRRFYVHLTGGDDEVVVVAERLVPLQGTRNFRDLGGYAGIDGRRVRWGKVFRSDHLGELVDADFTRLERLGVHTIVDFRNPHEHVHSPPHPRLLDGTITWWERPIHDGPTPGVTFYQRVEAKELTSFAAADLARFYIDTLENSATTFGDVLGMIADPTQHSLVFHCAAGKDRTGLTAALLLSLLGVSDDDILDDYELTNVYRSGHRVEALRPELTARGIDIDALMALFVAPRTALHDALAELRARYGDVERYVSERGGLERSAVKDLRRHLLQ